MMTTTATETIESLFLDFLEEPTTGDLAAELARISAQLDDEIRAGAVSFDTVAAYEAAAMRRGFYAGYMAAQTADSSTTAAE